VVMRVAGREGNLDRKMMYHSVISMLSVRILLAK